MILGGENVTARPLNLVGEGGEGLCIGREGREKEENHITK